MTITGADQPAVLLLSGGLDSTTLLAHTLAEGFDVHAMTFRYGQRHATEIEAARRVAARFGVRDHVIVDIDLRTFGGSALTSTSINVPKDRDVAEMEHGIPITYVPARNTIFLSFALAWAEVLEAGDIFIGVNALDYSGYPDCRPEYIAAYERMANLATRGGVEGTNPIRVRTPLIDLTKAQIIRRGLSLGVDYAITQSCYDPGESGAACGHCDACQLRLKGFAEAGEKDPAAYRHPVGGTPTVGAKRRREEQ
jgi:7-cyano-7-deazaguanine synthase